MSVDLKPRMNEKNAAVLAGARRGSARFWSGFSCHWREWGAARSGYWLVMRFLARYLGIHVHYVAVGADRIDLSESTPPSTPREYDTRLVGKADLLPYAGRVPGITVDILEQAFEFGDECSASFYEGQLVAYGFIKRSRVIVTQQLDALVPEGFRYGYKAWTHPQHTQRGLARLGAYLRHEGPHIRFEERSVSYIETHNYASLLHSYLPPNKRFIRMGLVGWITLWGRQFPFNSRRAKWLGFEFVRKEDSGSRHYLF